MQVEDVADMDEVDSRKLAAVAGSLVAFLLICAIILLIVCKFRNYGNEGTYYADSNKSSELARLRPTIAPPALPSPALMRSPKQVRVIRPISGGSATNSLLRPGDSGTIPRNGVHLPLAAEAAAAASLNGTGAAAGGGAKKGKDIKEWYV